MHRSVKRSEPLLTLLPRYGNSLSSAKWTVHQTLPQIKGFHFHKVQICPNWLEINISDRTQKGKCTPLLLNFLLPNIKGHFGDIGLVLSEKFSWLDKIFPKSKKI